MHNSYYYIRQVSAALVGRLVGRRLDAAFTQDRDELVLTFLSDNDLFFVRAVLKNDFVCLTFPAVFHRARKNSVELFAALNGLAVTGIVQYENDRSFAVKFENDRLLLFKLHGNRANVLLYTGDTVAELFQNNIAADWELRPDSLHRPLDPTFDDFVRSGCRPAVVYPTLGKLPLAWLEQDGFAGFSPETQWQRLQNLLETLAHPSAFYVTRPPGFALPELSLLPFDEVGKAQWQGDDPLEAANQFYGRRAREDTFAREQGQALAKLEKRRKQTENYLAKTYEKLDALLAEARHEQTANILVAKLHQIPEGDELTGTNRHLAAVQTAQDLKTLRNYLKDNSLSDTETVPQPQDLFRRYEHMGFEILVGKNAKNNDLLTREYAWKEDLWLHAKDVSGSHVVVKYQSGKPFPEPVVERAAQLAAFFSKRKHDTLCPVTVTPRKYVRKAKGLPDGAVIVDKEKVVLVEPRE